MSDKDYYRILGVNRDADDADIKRAYRKLAQEYHPDKHSGDKTVEEKFKTINEAYEILKDPEKRARYDRFGAAEARGPFAEGGFGPDFQDFFGDIFSDFFGGRQRQGPQPGDDLRYDLEIGFEESVSGATKKIEIKKTVQCAACRGTRAKPGTSAATCPNCKGNGQIFMQQGFLRIARPCPNCRGEGRTIPHPCEECKGLGFTHAARTLTINVPPGVDSGARLRISNEGEAGTRGGRPGDLYVFLTVRPHPIFKREGDDIICEVPISFPQATLGGEIEVPTIDGKTKLKIPAGTQSGKVFNLKSKGAPSLRTGRRGDQMIVVNVETPAKLNKRQRELIEELGRITNDESFPQKKSFLDKVKELFG